MPDTARDIAKRLGKSYVVRAVTVVHGESDDYAWATNTQEVPIDGTDGMLGMLVLAISDLRTLLRTADVAAAMSVEAQLATDRVFAADLQALRPHPGQAASAANLVRILADSGVVASHRGPDCNRVQDAYSLRCSPQVHGAARDTVDHAATVAERELASAVDNPVVVDGRLESNGKLHGAPVAYVLAPCTAAAGP